MTSAALELAQAYVSLIPSFDGSQGHITRQLVPEAERAGDEAGEAAGEGFSGKFKLAAAGAAAAAGALLVDGFMKNLEGQGANNKISAAMGLSPEQSKKSGEVAGSLWSSGYGDGLEDVTAAVGDVMGSITGMADASAPELESLTKKAMSFATAMDTDVATAAGTASLLINNGLAVDGVAAFDLLTAASQKVPSSMREDLSAASQEYGTFFSSLGFSGEEMFTALVDGSANGVIGIDKAGDAIKEFTIRATDGSTSTSDALASIGLDANTMANDILAGGLTARSATQDIVDGLLGITDPAAQSAAAIALFGSPLEDMNTAEIPAFLDSLSNMSGGLGDVDGAAGKLDTTLNAGAASGIETLKRSFQGAFMEMSEDLLPVVTKFTSWAAENPGVVKAVAWGITALAVGLGIAAAAQWVMNSALLASPLTWIVVGVMALIAAIIALAMNWDSVTAWIGDTWSSFTTWLGESFDGVGEWFSNLWEGILNFIKEWGPRFLIAIGGPFVWLAAFLITNWDSIYQGAKNGLNAVVDWVKKIPGWLVAAFLNFTLPGLLIKHWDSIYTGAKEKFTSLIDWVGGVPQSILDKLGNVGTLLKDAGKQMITGFLGGLTQKFEDVKKWVGGVGTWIADHKGPKAYDLALLRPAGGWIMTGLQDSMEDQIPSLRRTLGKVTDAITLNAGVRAPNLGPDYSSAAMANTFATEGVSAGGVSVTVNEARADPIATATAVVRHITMGG